MSSNGSVIPSIFQRLIQQQRSWSRALDRRLPPDISVDARAYFQEHYIGRLITPHSRIYDVGGGRFPSIPQSQKQLQDLYVVGLDLNLHELEAAPPGIYDLATAADITDFEGKADADFIVSETVLEHVRDTSKAFHAFRTILKPGGHALIFVPCRNAIFARMNLLLPETWKRRLLSLIYPATRGSGWPAYYNRCTPSDFRKLAEDNGFDVVELKPFYFSAYFQFCFPLYFLWRLWVLLARAVMPEQAAETFCMCIRKR